MILNKRFHLISTASDHGSFLHLKLARWSDHALNDSIGGLHIQNVAPMVSTCFYPFVTWQSSLVKRVTRVHGVGRTKGGQKVPVGGGHISFGPKEESICSKKWSDILNTT